MKPLYSVLLLVLLALAPPLVSQAAGPLTVVSFSVERGLPFSLLLDGRPVGRGTTSQAQLDYLVPGRHLVELGLDAGPLGRRPVRVRAAVWLSAGLETTFVLTERPGYGWQLRQVSTAALPGYGYEGQDGTYGAGDSYPAPAGPGGPGRYPGSGSYPRPAPGYPAGPAYPAPALGGNFLIPLSPEDAADLVQTLKSYPFDDKRLAVLHQSLGHSYLRASELADMVHTLTFSKSQVEAAKFGYAHLADPQNFYRVLDALTFPTDADQVLKELDLTRN